MTERPDSSMALRYVYHGCDIGEVPAIDLHAARPHLNVSPHDAVSGDIRHTQFIHCSHSAVSAIFYGSTWGGQRDARVAKIDLQKVTGCRVIDVSTADGAKRSGLKGKALQLAVDAKEILLVAAPGAGLLIIPPEAITLHKVTLGMLSPEQRSAGQRASRHKWSKRLQAGRRMQVFCSSTPPELKSYIVENIYQPSTYRYCLATGTYHFSRCCARYRQQGMVQSKPARSLGLRPCENCMVLGTDEVTDEIMDDRPINLCHFFWHTLNAPAGVLQIRLLNIFSLKSAVAQGHTVWIWCYQTFANLPIGVIVKDANELLPFSEFQAALSSSTGSTIFDKRRRNNVTPGRHVAHLSDLIRVRALLYYGGWWLDMDTIVIETLPTDLPYSFSTHPERRADRQALKNGRLWHAHTREDYPDWDGQDSFQNTPIYVSKAKDPLVIEWEARIAPLILSPCRLEWLQVIREMEACIVRHGLQRYVAPPDLFCPYPFWSNELLEPDKGFVFSRAYNKYVSSIQAALQYNAYTVQTFFMSSSSTQTERRDDAWLRAQLDKRCAFYYLLRFAGVL